MPPVTRYTFPEKSKMSVSGLKLLPPIILGRYAIGNKRSTLQLAGVVKDMEDVAGQRVLVKFEKLPVSNVLEEPVECSS